jgi:predicted RNase H-like HicB family nuclease
VTARSDARVRLRGRGAGEVVSRAQDYEIDIRPLSQEEGGGFVAIAPELPGCRSDGETPEEALRNGYVAVSCWIEAGLEMGRQVPSPRKQAA